MSTTTPLPSTPWTPAAAGSGATGENVQLGQEHRARTQRTSRRAAAFTVLLALGLTSAFFAIQLLLTEPTNHTERPLLAGLSIIFLVAATRVAGPRTLSNTGN